MRKTLKQVLQILDGKPTRMRGQSMTELALTMPIFLIMLVGLTEVGWFANNYLILTDVVRSAGRYGSIHDPMEWAPGEEWNNERHDCDVVGTGVNGEDVFTTPHSDPGDDLYAQPLPGPDFYNGVESDQLGYYDGVACDALVNMLPLDFKDGEDDIVVSVFSYATFQNCGSGPCIRIVGRYPNQANECATDTFDPFDADRDGVVDTFENATFFDNPGGGGSEGYRGYVFRAHQVPDDDNSCIGSDFSNERMEELLNSTLVKSDITQDATPLELGFIPNYGLVLVEMQWNSYQLLGLPFFSWVGNPIRVRVWSLFPVSAAEPDLDCWTNPQCVRTD